MKNVWEKLKEKILNILDEHSFELWFSKIEPVEISEKNITLKAPNSYYSKWFSQHCADSFKEILKNEFNFEKIQDISFIYQQEEPMTSTKQVQPMETKMFSRFNPRYTFENFVVGQNNRFAYSISKMVAEEPGEQYNPVFIYSSVGLGKTHLLQAVGNEMIKRGEKNVMYITPERFVTEYIDSIKTSQIKEFRKKYSSLKCLLIDDIHHLIGKESSQEEFFFIFNLLHDTKKQIVITSDRPPRDLLPGIQERLVNRFEWGVRADIKEPDLETRIAILKKKCELENFDMPEDVIIFIAERIQTNVRKLEGALISFIAYITTSKEHPTIDLAKAILKDYFDEQEKKIITPEKIIQVVSNFFNIPQEKLKSRSRQKDLAKARQIGMYLIRNLTDLSVMEIGKFFGNKTHPDVIHAVKKIKNKIETDPHLANTINQIIQEIQP